MNTLAIVETLVSNTTQALGAKRMMLAFVNDEASSSLINASIAMDEAQLKMLEAHKKLGASAQAPVEVHETPVETPKRKLSPAQKQWLDEVSAVMKEYPSMSIEEARREASRRREEGYELSCYCPVCEEDEEYVDEEEDEDDEEYVEEKAPRSFHQKRWNDEVAAVMKEHPEWTVKQASKEASARRMGFSTQEATYETVSNFLDSIIAGAAH